MKGNTKYLVGAVLVLVGIGFILTSSLQNNLVFFITPSEFSREQEKYANRTIRLGGVVEPGSIAFNRDTLDLTFKISDGTTVLPMTHRGTPPDLFREGMGVTVQGRLENGVFKGEELLVRHSEEYKAPKPGEKLDYTRIMDAIKDSR
jgi:cytochrome c-type biogenesis protein CcmE